MQCEKLESRFDKALRIVIRNPGSIAANTPITNIPSTYSGSLSLNNNDSNESPFNYANNGTNDITDSSTVSRGDEIA